MSKAHYTDDALDDIDAILERIAIDDFSAAERWATEIDDTVALLGSQPLMGEALRSRRTKDVRRHSLGNYVIYYRPRTGGIDVLRVVHGARRPPRRF